MQTALPAPSESPLSRAVARIERERAQRAADVERRTREAICPRCDRPSGALTWDGRPAICTACANALEEARRPRPPEGHDAELWHAIQWSGRAGDTACCADARRTPCVCRISITCPTHGTRCWGTHD